MPRPVQASSVGEEAGTAGEGTHLLRGGFIIASAGGDVDFLAGQYASPVSSHMDFILAWHARRGCCLASSRGAMRNCENSQLTRGRLTVQ